MPKRNFLYKCNLCIVLFCSIASTQAAAIPKSYAPLNLALKVGQRPQKLIPKKAAMLPISYNAQSRGFPQRRLKVLPYPYLSAGSHRNFSSYPQTNTNLTYRLYFGVAGLGLATILYNKFEIATPITLKKNHFICSYSGCNKINATDTGASCGQFSTQCDFCKGRILGIYPEQQTARTAGEVFVAFVPGVGGFYTLLKGVAEDKATTTLQGFLKIIVDISTCGMGGSAIESASQIVTYATFAIDGIEHLTNEEFLSALIVFGACAIDLHQSANVAGAKTTVKKLSQQTREKGANIPVNGIKSLKQAAALSKKVVAKAKKMKFKIKLARITKGEIVKFCSGLSGKERQIVENNLAALIHYYGDGNSIHAEDLQYVLSHLEINFNTQRRQF